MTDPVSPALRPFDAGDPFDAMADSFRTQVAEMALNAVNAAIFRDLSPVAQLQCIMSGTLTGLFGVCFSYVGPEGHEAIVEAVREFIPSAAANAKHISEGAGRD